MAGSFARPNALLRTGAWMRAHPYTLVAAVCFLGYAVPFQLRGHSEWHDVYMKAGSRLLAGEHIYLPTADYIGYVYVYPPFAALMAVPFTLLPHHVARMAWYLLNVLCLVLLLRWAWRLSGGGPLQDPAPTRRGEHLICILGLVCTLGYAVNCLAHQQTDLLIAALMMGGCLALSRSRWWQAATVFGLAAAVKCTPLLWGPYLLWRGRWKEAVWLACVAVGANLLPNLLGAPEQGRLYLVDWTSRFLLPMNNSDRYPGTWASAPIYNQSLAGTANRWALTECKETALDCEIVARPNPPQPRTLKFLVYGGQFLLVVGALFVLGRRPVPESALGSKPARIETGAEYGVVLLLMLFLSPMSNTQHFVTMVLPAFCLARLGVQRRQWLPGILLLLAIAVRATEIKWLWGERFSTRCLWLGCVTGSAAFLLAGCAYMLVSSRRSSGNATPVALPMPVPMAPAA